jgi:hypothetical protein
MVVSKLIETIDWEGCQIDPAPFQLVERTSLHKVGWIFWLENKRNIVQDRFSKEFILETVKIILERIVFYFDGKLGTIFHNILVLAFSLLLQIFRYNVYCCCRSSGTMFIVVADLQVRSSGTINIVPEDLQQQ